jgi:tetratricopeptide (TPR) repeat protein
VPCSRAAALRSRCWSVLGEISRRCGDLEGAERAFDIAERTLEPEDLEFMERAFLCRHLARLRRDQGRIDEALGLFERAANLASMLAEDEEWGAALSDEGWLRLEQHDAESALRPFQQAVEVLAPSRAAGAALLARYGLALAWAEWGDTRRAREAQREARAIQAHLPYPIDQLLGLWLDARIEAACGQVGPAVVRLELAARALAEEKAPYEAAAVALELARVMAEHGHEGLARVTELLEPILAAGKLRGLAPEVVAFSMSFARRAPARSLELLERARAYLFRARLAPELPFLPSRGLVSSLEWQYLGSSTRLELCELAGVPVSHAHLTAAEIDPSSRRALSWAYEELRGVRVLFEEGPQRP